MRSAPHSLLYFIPWWPDRIGQLSHDRICTRKPLRASWCYMTGLLLFLNMKDMCSPYSASFGLRLS